eukprot:SAG11_NODE_808_length_7088_cov_5.136357_10_plen_62_part_00
MDLKSGLSSLNIVFGIQSSSSWEPDILYSRCDFGSMKYLAALRAELVSRFPAIFMSPFLTK